ncbi:MAG: Fic family protein [Gammaproteobacteria bacterium]|nr:Fic family protein [Gammaproteobacteria bacterium]
MWIWQQAEWPRLRYDAQAVLPHLEACARRIAPLAELAGSLEVAQRLDWEAAILLDETLATAKIEGEQLDRASVRSSIANCLGLGRASQRNKKTDGLVEVLLQAIRNSDKALSHIQLKAWQQMLFPQPPLIGELTRGDYRNGPMCVRSGRYGRQKTHFVAPGDSRQAVTAEMEQFLHWLNAGTAQSGYIRAALAKFHFVTIHPFDDGNGRLSRVIAEKCLGQAEHTRLRLYSLSGVIERRRGEYYDQLERCQRGTTDITAWVCWFLDAAAEAGQEAGTHFQRLISRTRFWQQHQNTLFNSRQVKLLKRLLETTDFADGISRHKYRSLVKTSEATAARDLADLVEKKVFVPKGEGRGRRYCLVP